MSNPKPLSHDDDAFEEDLFVYVGAPGGEEGKLFHVEEAGYKKPDNLIPDNYHMLVRDLVANGVLFAAVPLNPQTPDDGELCYVLNLYAIDLTRIGLPPGVVRAGAALDPHQKHRHNHG